MGFHLLPHLVAQGVSVSRLVAKALAESRPAVSNQTLEGRQKNRWVELVPIK